MFRKLSSNPIPKTNQESQTLESVDVSQHETKASFNSLPNALIKHLLLFTFLGVKDAACVLPTVSKEIAALLKDKSMCHQFEVQVAFRHLVRGEQDQVKAILEKAKKNNPYFLLSLLKSQVTITDHAKRQFDKITLFQLAVWYLDRHMWEMLLEYLPKEEAAIQLQEHESGKASYVKEHGRHYDFEGPKGLVSALKNYVQLREDNPREEIDWERAADEQWKSGVGGAQGQAPLHVIHEYCRTDVAFYPLTETRFKEKTLPRGVNFSNRLTKNRMTFWEGLCSHFGLGTAFGLYKMFFNSNSGDKLACAWSRAGQAQGLETVQGMADSAAVNLLCQVREEEYELLKKDLILKPDSSQEESSSLSLKAGL